MFKRAAVVLLIPLPIPFVVEIHKWKAELGYDSKLYNRFNQPQQSQRVYRTRTKFGLLYATATAIAVENLRTSAVAADGLKIKLWKL